MKIKEGEKIPNSKVFIMSKDGPKEISMHEVIGKEKVILFGVPGAFTPTCSAKHLPSFINSMDEVKKKGIRKVICVSVNDPYVMDGWGKSQSLKDQILLLADVKGEFTKKIGAEFNWRGWALRSMRYTMLLENEVISKMVFEEGKCELTAAENFLKTI